MPLKIEQTKTAHLVSSNNLESFIASEIGFDHYDLVILEQLDHEGFTFVIEVRKMEIDDIDREMIEEMIHDKRDPEDFYTRELLCYLCEQGKIPEGVYIIQN